MEILDIYVTFANQQEAQAIAEKVVRERLAACANIFSPHIAIYWWDNTIENKKETAVLFKTTKKKFEKLRKRIIDLHSYECPCIVSWEIDSGNIEFLKWIQTETGEVL